MPGGRRGASLPPTTTWRARWPRSRRIASRPRAWRATRSPAGRAPASSHLTTRPTGTERTTSVSVRVPTRSVPRERRAGAGGTCGCRSTGAPPVGGEERLVEAQAQGDFVITGLRRLVGVDVAEFERRFGIALAAAFPQLAGLARDGLVGVGDGRLRLTRRGLRFADTVGAL